MHNSQSATEPRIEGSRAGLKPPSSTPFFPRPTAQHNTAQHSTVYKGAPYLPVLQADLGQATTQTQTQTQT